MTGHVLLLAALLIVAVAAAHSWLGERRLIGPLTAPKTRAGLLADSRHARRLVRIAWHVTSLGWVGLAALLVVIAGGPPPQLARTTVAIVGVTFLLTGMACLPGGRRHLAWAAFLAIASLTGVALWLEA